MAQMVKNLPAMRETRVRSLDQEDSWRREWLPTLVFLPEDFQGQWSLVGYVPKGRKELDLSELTEHTHTIDLQCYVSIMCTAK